MKRHMGAYLKFDDGTIISWHPSCGSNSGAMVDRWRYVDCKKCLKRRPRK